MTMVCVIFLDDVFVVALLVVLFVSTILMCGIIVKYLTIGNLYKNSVVENFRVLDYIANDNEESVWFCKHLQCDIFYQVKKINGIHVNGCSIDKTKPNIKEYYEPSNVVEAIIRSNNEKYFEIISQWYDEVKTRTMHMNDDNFYSYAHKEIELDYELTLFIANTCTNWKVFEEFVCNDAFNADKTSEFGMHEMFECSFALRSKQASKHLWKTFESKLDGVTRNRIRNKFIKVYGEEF